MRSGSTNPSSSPVGDDRLVRVPLDRLHEHPANANVMSAERRETLGRHIAREGRYPPLIVRPHPDLEGDYQLLDGHQRCAVLRSLGHRDALCYVWPCDDTTALLLLATFNRLEGEDAPDRRADLLHELRALLPLDVLASLLPESADELEAALAWSELDGERLLAELEAAAATSARAGPRLISFAVEPDDEVVIEDVIRRVAAGLDGRNCRGRALALICMAYREASDG